MNRLLFYTFVLSIIMIAGVRYADAAAVHAPIEPSSTATSSPVVKPKKVAAVTTNTSIIGTITAIGTSTIAITSSGHAESLRFNKQTIFFSSNDKAIKHTALHVGDLVIAKGSFSNQKGILVSVFSDLMNGRNKDEVFSVNAMAGRTTSITGTITSVYGRNFTVQMSSGNRSVLVRPVNATSMHGRDIGENTEVFMTGVLDATGSFIPTQIVVRGKSLQKK